MNIPEAKATLSELETRLHAAMQSKLDRLPGNHTTSHDSLGASTVGTGCIVEVSSDTNAMFEALAEFGFRLAMEEPGTWEERYDRVTYNAQKRVLHKLVGEIKSRLGYLPPKG